jgi:quercetin dioxygenase-like cupin family protein
VTSADLPDSIALANTAVPRVAAIARRSPRNPFTEIHMTVVEQTEPSPTPIPGLAHATWAGAADGLQQLSVWRQRLAPGAATPMHRHDQDEVVLCLSGHGELLRDGASRRFEGGDTVVLPRGPLHQIVNIGTQPLEIVGVFGGTPVDTYVADGTALSLPWRT